MEDLTVHYYGSTVLKNISFDVQNGEVVGFVGPAGSGKSTLVNTLSGLVTDWEGRITFDGIDMRSFKNASWKIVKAKLIQCPERRHNFSSMTVRDNLELGAYASRKTLSEKLDIVFELFPVLRTRQGQLAGTLSGGEAQMVAIGRSLMSDSKLLMLDEPMLGLAPIVRDDIISALRRLEKSGYTLLVTEQEIYVATRICRRLFLIREGRIVARGTPDEFLNDPSIAGAYFGVEM